MAINVGKKETESRIKGNVATGPRGYEGRLARFDQYQIVCQCGYRRTVSSGWMDRLIHRLTCKAGKEVDAHE